MTSKTKPSKMGKFFCLTCGKDDVMGESFSPLQLDAPVEQTDPKRGLSVQCVIDLFFSPLPLTARELIESVILPKTKDLRSSYAQILSTPSQLGVPTLYVALSWDVNLKLALEAVLQHVGVPESALQTDNKAAATAWAADQPQLARTFLFFDFLCINLWARASPLFNGRAASESIKLQQQHQAVKPEDLKLRPHSDVARMDSSHNLQLLSDQRSLEAFVETIKSTLTCRQPGVALLLHLDPELRVLGSLIPMHAAWTAMHAGLTVHFACSPELAWPYQSPHANLFYTLNEAEEPNERIREALFKDIHDACKAVELPSPSRAGDVEQRVPPLGRMIVEEQGLWKALLQAATISTADQAIDVTKAVHHSFVQAVFLKLDGQYRQSRDKLVEANAAMVAAGSANSTKCLQVLCLLVQVFLRLGSLLEAESAAKQALQISATSSQAFSLLCMHARACHALALEALQRPAAAEQEWRSTYIQLDRHLGHRHPLTLEFMAHLGRLLSKMRGRQEEGAMLLSECLKGNARLKGLSLASSTSQVDLPLPAPEPSFNVSPRQMQLLIARLSCDLAVVLRQVATPQDEDDSEFSGGCHCTNQIIVAFQSMGQVGGPGDTGSQEGPSVGPVCKLSPSALAEAEGLWRHTLHLLETLCGPQHEACCLWRARYSAEKLLSGIALDMSTGALLPPARTGSGSGLDPGGSGGHTGSSGHATGSSTLVPTTAKQTETVRATLAAMRAEIEMLWLVLGPGFHISMLEAKSLLARTLEVLGSPAEAEVQWKLVADGCQRLLGEGSAHWAKAMTRLSGCRAKQGRYEEAAQDAVQAAAALAASTGKLSIQTGAARLRLAEMYREAGSLAESEATLHETIEIYTHCYGATNWRTKQVAQALADVYDSLAKPKEAERVRRKYKIQSSIWLGQ